ncbi:unnamed protein product [Anisakis simplex]|uniref:tRNA_int_endo domain-containing protein n=1 Tax=Anisakis simplex TaxID=6269 RepID=A0A0M3KGW2_ANISI|nr:unnamed protein product [Anisakis simplex]
MTGYMKAIREITDSSRQWTTIYERQNCDLQHAYVKRATSSDGCYWSLYVNKWDEQHGWNVAHLMLDDSFKFLSENAIITPDGGNLVEPWTICVISESCMAVYDYKLGGISMYTRQHDSDKWTQSDIIGAVLAGQWVSLSHDETYIYALCCDEKLIRRFRRKRFHANDVARAVDFITFHERWTSADELWQHQWMLYTVDDRFAYFVHMPQASYAYGVLNAPHLNISIRMS